MKAAKERTKQTHRSPNSHFEDQAKGRDTPHTHTHTGSNPTRKRNKPRRGAHRHTGCRPTATSRIKPRRGTHIQAAIQVERGTSQGEEHTDTQVVQ